MLLFARIAESCNDKMVADSAFFPNFRQILRFWREICRFCVFA
ncbi:DUF321 domain-containing protein [Helicobacter sp. 23-1044]